MTKPDDIPQDVWDAATSIEVMDETVCDWDYNLHIDIARAIMAAKAEEREYADELRGILGEILVVLRKEAPGTPLNNHKYDHLGIRAYDAMRKRGEAD